jgi:hypothetical protein
VITSEGDIHASSPSGFQLSAQTGDALQAVWVADDGTPFAGGQNGAMWTLDAGQWVPIVIETGQLIVSIHGSSSSDVFAATVGSLHHYDGAIWSPVENANAPLLDVFTTPTDAYFAPSNAATIRRLMRNGGW